MVNTRQFLSRLGIGITEEVDISTLLDVLVKNGIHYEAFGFSGTQVIDKNESVAMIDIV